MGAVQSDLKASIVQASAKGVAIPSTNDEFWQIFWTRPETAEHVFETFTPTDIRTMRDDQKSFENLQTLALKTSLVLLKHRYLADSLSDEHAKTGVEVLNCVRILTRILPFIYESDRLEEWENNFFWRKQQWNSYGISVSDTSRYFDTEESLGVQLVNVLVDLLFYTGFTLPWAGAEGQGERRGVVTYGLWQSGIACDTTVVTNKDLESRRTEILQLLLTLESKSIYAAPSAYIDRDVQAIDCIVRHGDKRRVQALLCSLLNTIIKYHPDTWLPSFDSRNNYGDSTKETHVRTCLHFLLVNLLNRAPWDDSPQEHNEFRAQFGYLHKAKHFQFLADGIFKILRQPLESNTNVLSLAQKSLVWAPEMVLLLWEALYSNKKYLHYVVETGRALDLIVLLLYHANESRMDGIGRVCVFCLQTLSAEPAFGKLLDRPFDAHDTLPASIQIKNFHGKYSDYVFKSFLSLIESSGSESNLWSASLISTMNNIAPEATGLARATSSKLMQSFKRMSSPAFLMANDGNVILLSSLLETISTLIECHERLHENENVLYAVWRARDTFESLRELCLLSEEELQCLDLDSPSRTPRQTSPERTTPRTPSEKSRGKQPGIDNSSIAHVLVQRLPDLPLHTPLTLISNLNQHVATLPDGPETADDAPALTPISTGTSLRSPSKHSIYDVLHSIREAGTSGIERREATIDVFQFQPAITALYASFYWGLIISRDLQRASDTGKGIWVGTNVQLFKIKAGQVHGPSLRSPKGAVDAVGESLVAGVMDLTMRARQGITGENKQSRTASL